MPAPEPRKKSRPFRVLFENSLFLVGGAVIALAWANIDHHSYEQLVEHELWPAAPGHEGHNTVHFFVNGVLMAFFFAIAGKEVWEAILPGGPLSNPRKAGTPLFATVGGMAGPALLYLAGVQIFDPDGVLARGWAIPCATDIAFSYLIARLIFGPGHPAIAFLLLLAIADDAGGLIILAVAYPKGHIQPVWLVGMVAAVVLGFGLRRLKLQSFWWYLVIPGSLSWFSLYKAGVEPALGLIPIIPTMPHAHTDLGIFAREELGRHDALNAFEHWWKNPVELILGLFGLINAGVAFGNVGIGTTLVLVGLLVGKPVGITLFTLLGEKVFRLEMPASMNYRDIFVLGVIAGIGFTVALFVCTAAFPKQEFPPEIVDAVKMGALASFAASILAVVAARVLRIRRWNASSASETSDEAAPEKLETP